MLIKLLALTITSIITAILYRMGGADKPYASWMRDWTIPGVVILAYCILTGSFMWSYWWVYLATYGLMGGMLSAYWRQDEKKYGFFWHGLGIALSLLPLMWISGHLLGYLIRLVTLPILIAWWSDRESNVVMEECGRGALITLTLLPYIWL